jgi:1,4-alpha-glucan branching enzyme
MNESRLTDQDIYLFNEGTHHRLHEKLGAHPGVAAGVAGTHFAVWAPNARSVSVIGSFNGWDPRAHRLEARGESGIWESFVAGVKPGVLYKYHIVSRQAHYTIDKADPLGFFHQIPPLTASVVWDLDYRWGDGDWMKSRGPRNAADAPISIYEIHPGSWRRVPEEGHRSLSYRELAPRLADHIAELGFTHVEFMPVMEHPFFGSWGYQVTGYFAPSSRYGTPQDLMHLVDTLHQRGIGVVLDWVPSHFPSDGHGLAFFDGTHLYEHADPRLGYHPDWNSYIFNYGRNEVRSFLLSNALFWLETYHADALRVDAVASMLYRDYSRKEGEWIPNQHGGRENLEAIDFLRRLNTDAYARIPGIQTIAEESTAWPMVSRPVYIGGLGFGMKWDMGWMHDSLKYFAREPVHRPYHHQQLTFRGLYAFTENFVLPLSHDEVVHGKGSLLGKMPGDEWQRFANMRTLLGYMYTQPGKKLLFMGVELGQQREWDHDAELDWELLDRPLNAGLRRWLSDLNRIYRDLPAAHQLDFDSRGFEWVDADDSPRSVLSYLRRSRGDEWLLVVLNLTPAVRHDYRLGVPCGGRWTERLNSDAADYGGSGVGNWGGVEAVAEPCHGRAWSVRLTLPPLGVLVLQAAGASERQAAPGVFDLPVR